MSHCKRCRRRRDDPSRIYTYRIILDVYMYIKVRKINGCWRIISTREDSSSPSHRRRRHCQIRNVHTVRVHSASFVSSPRAFFFYFFHPVRLLARSQSPNPLHLHQHHASFHSRLEYTHNRLYSALIVSISLADSVYIFI